MPSLTALIRGMRAVRPGVQAGGACPFVPALATGRPDVSQRHFLLPLSRHQSSAGAAGRTTLGWLLAIDGLHVGEDFRLVDGDNVVGSGQTVDLVITSPGVSRRHARVHMSSEGAEIHDLDSKDGLFVNGARVRKMILVEGDEVRLGPVKFRYVSLQPSPLSGGESFVALGATLSRPAFYDRIEPGKLATRGWLIARTGPWAGQDFRLVLGENTVGSAHDESVTLVDAKLRPRQAIIHCSPEECRLEVTGGPEGGVLVNGRLERDVVLAQGDVAVFGNEEFEFRWL